MDIKEIKTLYRFIKDTDIVEIEVEREGGRVRLKRGTPAGEAPAAHAPAPQAPAPPSAARAEEGNAGAQAENVVVVTSPMVGTFYRAPDPDADPFAEVGNIVRPGQTLCIIEAMKLMNEVDSDVAGRVIAILVENGQPVEYGEPLMHIEVSK
ncbi:MAG: acetyl-CoA carboxylase biotin carboxyl carrier protein [Thermodesulfobacteriota bacterium]